MKKTVALILIGQAPRQDTEAELRRIVPGDLAIVQRGALDDLSRPEIEAAQPVSDDDALFTRLADGTPVSISKAVVHAGVQRRLDELSAEGIDVAYLACTGSFEHLRYDGVLLLPSGVLLGVVGTSFRRGRLGVLVPLAEQVGTMTERWNRDGVDVVAEALQPGSDDATIDEVVETLVARKPDMIVMDCMGYSSTDKARLRRQFDGPVVLAVSATARMMQELVA
ncbi:AroM family protein [Consotaella aegiceratis]|uniref:AroM family protein n=1 Tax=Consotaella aegiceratis TaxID=3097961 RepID=UPI002F3E5B97